MVVEKAWRRASLTIHKLSQGIAAQAPKKPVFGWRSAFSAAKCSLLMTSASASEVFPRILPRPFSVKRRTDQECITSPGADAVPTLQWCLCKSCNLGFTFLQNLANCRPSRPFVSADPCEFLLICNSSPLHLAVTPPPLPSPLYLSGGKFMSTSGFLANARQHLAVGASLVALIANLGAPLPAAAEDHHKHSTATPIKHLIVIIGENRTFDHVFATYQPRHGESVSNLLSKGIVNQDGTPGPNFSLASQSSASDTSVYELNPSGNAAYSVLPPVLAGGYSSGPFPDAATAMTYENGLLPADYVLLTTGGTGLAHGAVDTRIPNASSLPNGPFQLTSASHPYDSYDNSPVHRFYQMWQQFDCNIANATSSKPTGCKADLFPWVEDTIGAGTNGLA